MLILALQIKVAPVFTTIIISMLFRAAVFVTVVPVAIITESPFEGIAFPDHVEVEFQLPLAILVLVVAKVETLRKNKTIRKKERNPKKKVTRFD
jgi:hypothetical protein